ncbi:hypothetical protein VCRA2110O318_40069 [Vibrio crassostreae]|nr:hypothetical protein VCRA2117O328_40069 [Vibrio crassostreae]CAK2335676.1 hypothetical protein VCRA2110O318_40069 [Vibrio crassostreae]CAK2504240.1 hypothetical protein VCRA2110O319_50070 [Vibrio crassostreae]CAK2908431.1 hypothetical protein VCRA217O317_30223 [Vibrio crassostreae]
MRRLHCSVDNTTDTIPKVLNGGLGDTIWAPVSNKLGKWRMTVELKGNIIADKTFNLVAKDEGQFWKRRGF